MIKKIILSIIAIAILIQFIPTKRDNNGVNTNDLISVMNPPADVASILKSSCYNCHSNKTDYPWYSNIQPLKYFIQHHVEEGQDYINFGEWSSLSDIQKGDALRECAEEVERNHMPPKGYRLLHKEARLSDSDHRLLLDWLTTKGGSL